MAHHARGGAGGSVASVDWYTVGGTVVGIVVGGIITYLVSRHYYVRAARSLEQETDRLHRHTTLILRGLEEAELVEYRRDEQGEIERVIIKARASMGSSSSVSARATVRRHENDAPQQPQAAPQRPWWRRVFRT